MTGKLENVTLAEAGGFYQYVTPAEQESPTNKSHLRMQESLWLNKIPVCTGMTGEDDILTFEIVEKSDN